MAFVDALDGVLWTLKDLGFYPLLLLISLSLWSALKERADRLTAGIFAFSVAFAFLWLMWFLQIGASAVLDRPINLERHGAMLVTMGIATVLFVFTGIRSGRAVIANAPIAWPMTTLYALIFAHAFHVAALMIYTVYLIDPAR